MDKKQIKGVFLYMFILFQKAALATRNINQTFSQAPSMNVQCNDSLKNSGI